MVFSIIFGEHSTKTAMSWTLWFRNIATETSHEVLQEIIEGLADNTVEDRHR